MTINGRPLSDTQARTIRVALESFASSLHEEGLGDDEHGRAKTALYLASIADIRALISP